MTLTIQGLGTAIPRYRIPQSEAASAAQRFVWNNPQQARLLPILFRRSQVQRRGSVVLEQSPEGELFTQFYQPARDADDRGPTTATRMQRYRAEAMGLAERAARAALADADAPAREITQLVTVSCTGFTAPGIDVALIRQLGLPPSVGRTHVGFMGCHGALNGLRVAHAFVQADPRARVLLCAVELCSLHYQYGEDPQQIVANSLFADGAAALVVGGPAAADGADGSRWQVAASGSVLLPDSLDAMGWEIGDHGFQMSLSPRVPELIAQHLRPWLAEWLASAGTSLDAIRSWAIHPGGPRIVSSVAEALALRPSDVAASNAILAEHGNMSSPTILFVLQHLQAQAAERPCVALAFGPGLMAEAALLV